MGVLNWKRKTNLDVKASSGAEVWAGGWLCGCPTRACGWAETIAAPEPRTCLAAREHAQHKAHGDRGAARPAGVHQNKHEPIG
jgi:hypothetical protein